MAATQTHSGFTSCYIGEEGDSTKGWPLSLQSKISLTLEHEPQLARNARGIMVAEYEGEYKGSVEIEAMDFPQEFCARYAGATYTPLAATSAISFSIVDALGPEASAAEALVAALTISSDAKPGMYYWELTRSTAVLRRIDKGDDTELASMSTFTNTIGSRTALMGTNIVFFSVQQMHDGGGSWSFPGLNTRPRFFCISTSEQPTTGRLDTMIIRNMVPKAMGSEMEALTVASGTASFAILNNDITMRNTTYEPA